MKKLDVGQVITILANVGVIAGIVFLAFELQQNNDLLKEQVRSGIVSGIGASNAALYENTGGLASILFAATRGDGITEEESFRLERFADQNLVLWQSAFRAYQDRMIEYSDLNPVGWSSVFNDLIPGMPEYFEQNRSSFDQGFVEWMEENIVND